MNFEIFILPGPQMWSVMLVFSNQSTLQNMNLGSRVWQGVSGEFPEIRKFLFICVINEGFNRISRYKDSLFFLWASLTLNTPASFDGAHPCTDLYTLLVKDNRQCKHPNSCKTNR